MKTNQILCLEKRKKKIHNEYAKSYPHEMLISIRYIKDHPKHGEINYFENNQHTRTEYDKDHPKHGEIYYVEYHQHIRTEYHKDHPRYGEIYYVENGKHIHTNYNKVLTWMIFTMFTAYTVV